MDATTAEEKNAMNLAFGLAPSAAAGAAWDGVGNSSVSGGHSGTFEGAHAGVPAPTGSAMRSSPARLPAEGAS